MTFSLAHVSLFPKPFHSTIRRPHPQHCHHNPLDLPLVSNVVKCLIFLAVNPLHSNALCLKLYSFQGRNILCLFSWVVSILLHSCITLYFTTHPLKDIKKCFQFFTITKLLQRIVYKFLPDYKFSFLKENYQEYNCLVI